MKQMKFRSIFTMFLGLVALMGGLAGCEDRITEEEIPVDSGKLVTVPLVIVDMGTATTVSVVDEKKRFMGGMILPGVRISLDALTARASQLSGISIEEPKRLIGRNTVDCMKSGILYGNAAAVDGIVDRIEEYLGQDVTVIATGGMSKKIIPHCKREMILDADLLLKGLLVIYEKNRS